MNWQESLRQSYEERRAAEQRAAKQAEEKQGQARVARQQQLEQQRLDKLRYEQECREADRVLERFQVPQLLARVQHQVWEGMGQIRSCRDQNNWPGFILEFFYKQYFPARWTFGYTGSDTYSTLTNQGPYISEYESFILVKFYKSSYKADGPGTLELAWDKDHIAPHKKGRPLGDREVDWTPERFITSFNDTLSVDGPDAKQRFEDSIMNICDHQIINHLLPKDLKERARNKAPLFWRLFL